MMAASAQHTATVAAIAGPPAGPVTAEEWRKHREQSRQAMPDVLAGQELPDVLLLYQQETVAAIYENDVTVVEKGRRTGITWAVGAAAVLISGAARSAGGMDTLYIGYSHEMAREFIDTCAMWAKAFMPAASDVDECLFRSMKPNGETEDIKAFRITFASGFQILALTSRPRSLRGYQGFVIGDEAAFHDELDEVLKSALALLIWGGKVCIISTHDGDENPFNTLCNDIRAGRKPYKLVRIDFDRALSEGLYKRICLMRGKEWSPEAEAEWRKGIFAQYGDGADEELMCIPSRGKGAYLPLALLELRSDPDIPVVCWEMPDSYVAWPEHLRVAECRDWCSGVLAPLLARCDPNLRHYFGQDFARSGDLTVVFPLAVDQKLVRRAPFVLEVRNVPFDQQRQALWYLIDRLPLFTAGAMDASGNGAHVAELTAQEYGLGRIAQVKMTENWYRENMPRYKAAFEDGTIVIPRDANVIADHRAFKLVRGVGRLPDADTSNDKTKGKKAKRHGDSGIAGVLAYAATCAEVMEYAYEPAQPTGAGPRYDDDPDDARDAPRARFGKGAY
ncbi:terminase family protein [Nitratidesulfovibrio sp. HK-II]|uniref:hypothetical protein n=1 Tax=Nitratidesulfovibrio sp. HK-II TaxID=2009266 RepID=UPI000ECF4771|nr:hypothetical protein [Nitratidesulfovibrio sp. HK-II]GBO98288.1 hage terminase large subunit [Nitratidesulfovibrio sp. HK-II]